MRNQDRSVGYFILLLLALAAGAVRLDGEGARPGMSGVDAAAMPSGCSEDSTYCGADTTVAWSDT